MSVEIFKNVDVEYHTTTGDMFILDHDSDEQLAVFCVIEEENK